MPHPPDSQVKHFTAFRSAEEEIASAVDSRQRRESKGSHMAARSGYIVQTPDADQPYKVILEHEDGRHTEHACSTMREGEVIIWRNTPTRLARNTFFDRDATPRDHAAPRSSSRILR